MPTYPLLARCSGTESCFINAIERAQSLSLWNSCYLVFVLPEKDIMAVFHPYLSTL